MSKVIFTENAPAAIGPYSQAIASGNLLFAKLQHIKAEKTKKLLNILTL